MRACRSTAAGRCRSTSCRACWSLPTRISITLRDEFVGYVLPSKVHACILSGRRVLFVGSERSDVHLLCAESLPAERYRRAGTGDPDGMARALEEIAKPLK